MNSKVKYLKIVSCFILIFVMCMLSSCFDLGLKKKDGVDEHDFDNYYKEYLECFDNVDFLNQKLNKSSYNYKNSFFNDDCVNELRNWINNPNCVPYDEYCFVAIKFEKSMDISSISMYLRGNDIDESVQVGIYAFKLNSFSFSAGFASYDIWYVQKMLNIEHEGEDDYSFKKLEDYDVLNTNNALDYRNISLSNSWDSITLSFYEKGNADRGTPLQVNEDDYIVFMIKNNMGIGLEENMTKVSFCATNLLVASPSED